MASTALPFLNSPAPVVSRDSSPAASVSRSSLDGLRAIRQEVRGLSCSRIATTIRSEGPNSREA